MARIMKAGGKVIKMTVVMMIIITATIKKIRDNEGADNA